MWKICFFLNNISAHGGTEKISIALANELVRFSGYEISAVSLEDFDTPFFPIHPDVKTSSLKISSSGLRKNYFRAISRLRTYLKKNDVDFIVDVDIIQSAISIPATIGIKTKVVSWEHYHFFLRNESIVRKISRRLAPVFSGCVVTLTEADAQNYRDKCICKCPVVSISNFLENIPQKTATLNSKVILDVGHLIHGKGFDLLVRVWNSITPSIRKDWELHIIGEGEEKKNILRYLKDHQLLDSVKILPPTKQIREHYQQASIFAFTSRAEGFGLVLIEAQSFGLPVVSFDCPIGPAEIVRDSIDGFLIPDFDIDTFAGKLTLLMSDDSLRKEMGKNAYASAQRFQKEKIVEKWCALFEKLTQ